MIQNARHLIHNLNLDSITLAKEEKKVHYKRIRNLCSYSSDIREKSQYK